MGQHKREELEKRKQSNKKKKKEEEEEAYRLLELPRNVMLNRGERRANLSNRQVIKFRGTKSG